MALPNDVFCGDSFKYNWDFEAKSHHLTCTFPKIYFLSKSYIVFTLQGPLVEEVGDYLKTELDE